MTKTYEEITKLRKSSALADRCYKYIIKKIKVGMSEKEVAKLMDSYMLSHGATKLAFETIVGSGVNSSMIHSTPSDKIIEYGDVVQLDFGCIVDGYCSDISRVLFMGEIKKEYKKIYDIVYKSQILGVEKIKAGMSADKADAICRDYIRKKGYDFKHALGHGVGKEVHESPVISMRNKNETIENNTVFTIEPGIYIENKFGIRIEDTCVMKKGIVIPLNKITKEIVIINN